MGTVAIDSKIEELKQNLRDRERARDEQQSKINELTTKLADLKRSLPNLQGDVKAAEVEKEKALGTYAIDESQLPQLEKAREIYEKAKRAEAEAVELVPAIEKKLHQVSGKPGELDRLVQGAKHKLWRYIAEELGVEAREKVGYLVERAFAAQLLSSASAYDGLLKSIFPQPSIERMREVKEDLVETHL